MPVEFPLQVVVVCEGKALGGCGLLQDAVEELGGAVELDAAVLAGPAAGFGGVRVGDVGVENRDVGHDDDFGSGNAGNSWVSWKMLPRSWRNWLPGWHLL